MTSWNEVKGRLDLSPLEKLVWLERDQSPIYLGVELLAKKLGSSLRGVKYAAKNLKTLGLWDESKPQMAYHRGEQSGTMIKFHPPVRQEDDFYGKA